MDSSEVIGMTMDSAKWLWQEDICPSCGSVGQFKNKGSFDKCMGCGARISDVEGPLIIVMPDGSRLEGD